MIERRIGKEEIINAVKTGEIIASYPDDSPLPSFLVYGDSVAKPLHIVVGVDAAGGNCHIITVYQPDPAKWHEDNKTRKRK
ncbi:MAG: DUF4258 domain-containing protein [Nitrospinae bacterium]|nr:DUF4258 domain-containing protein [Nitrospinota bacterium]